MLGKTTNNHQLVMRSDSPDIRDHWYEPSLIQLSAEIKSPKDLTILDQGSEGACTGFGLAAVINVLNKQRGSDVHVSTRMLYEVARLYDEWPGEAYNGSSCRGAIRGWESTGVCEEDLWPYVAGDEDSTLTVARAKNARSNTLGAYYRLRHNITDFHTALNEVGVLYVSAQLHSGWHGEAIGDDGIIPLQQDMIGGHAFAIVGYNQQGFWVQNSWGESWGKQGLGLWLYEDWQQHIQDAWVLRLALPTPQIWHLPTYADAHTHQQIARAPRQCEILGHYAHIDDGNFDTKAPYPSSLASVKATAKVIEDSTNYQHIVLYAHGGLNSVKDSAKRIRGMKEVWKANGIYPFHFMYDTGIMEELKDVVFRREGYCKERAGGFFDWTDRILEKILHTAGRALWREMKSGATQPFCDAEHAGSQTIASLLAAAQHKGLKIHIVGHSTGAILLANLVQRAATLFPAMRISTATLLAPACTVEMFHSHYLPRLNNDGFGIDQLSIYALTDKQEQDDHVAQIYRKSLLYLVSKSFEEQANAPIWGMQRFASQVPPLALPHEFVYSVGEDQDDGRSRSTSHGGFDNDVATMNDVLKRVLGNAEAQRMFTKRDLNQF